MTFDRRNFLAACGRAGVASPLLPGILFTLASQAQEANTAGKPVELAKVTPEMIDQAAALADIGPFTGEEKKMMLEALDQQRGNFEAIRKIKLYKLNLLLRRSCFILCRPERSH